MPRGRRKHDAAMLEMALVGYQAERDKIESKIQEISARLKGRKFPAASRAPKKARVKRVLSAAARERIAAAQRKRWAEFHKKSAAK